MKRLSRAAAEPLRREARDILVLYLQRSEDERNDKGAKSTLPILQEFLRRGGISSGGSINIHSLRLSARQQWLVNVWWVLQELGFVTSLILLHRCTRREKSSEASWDRIVGEVRDTFGIELLESDAQALYDAGLPAFIRLLRDRKIDRTYLEESEISQRYRSFHCAGVAQQQPAA